MFKIVVLLLVANLFFVNGSLIKNQERKCTQTGAKCNKNAACCSKSCLNVGTTGAKICSVIPKKDSPTIVAAAVCLKRGLPCFTGSECCSERCFWKPMISSPGICVF